MNSIGSRYSLREVTAHDERILTTLYLNVGIPSRRDELANELRSKFPQFSVMISYEFPDRVAVRGRKEYIKHFVEKYIHHLEHALIGADMYIEVPYDDKERSEDLFKPYLNTSYIDTDAVRYNHFAKVLVKEDNEMNTNDIKNAANSIYGYTFNWTPKSRYFHPSMVKDVIFNPPATIVFWTDGTKTVVKCTDNEPFDPEKGMLMAIIKHCFNDRSTRTSKWMHQWTDAYYEDLINKETVDWDGLKKIANSISDALKDLGDYGKKTEEHD